MKALLDTHVFLWWILDEPQLPPNVRAIISDGDNELFLSAASCWEIAIKAKLDRISLPSRPEVFVPDQMDRNAIQPLQIKTGHALHVFNLPLLHRDPFDRMLVSQAQIEGLPIITSDPLISKYKVKTLWKR
ncbi:MAG: type II toxin-antitoxin system VapC family toxin [candidate division Zixibacteria bacterium]|nr:type II toxin-antitoxin system VapC family toxin [candidate division Zixibacteria bacterium]